MVETCSCEEIVRQNDGVCHCCVAYGACNADGVSGCNVLDATVAQVYFEVLVDNVAAVCRSAVEGGNTYLRLCKVNRYGVVGRAAVIVGYGYPIVAACCDIDIVVGLAGAPQELSKVDTRCELPAVFIGVDVLAKVRRWVLHNGYGFQTRCLVAVDIGVKHHSV